MLAEILNFQGAKSPLGMGSFSKDFIIQEETVKVIIMAGGKGTRISSVADDIPKPMIRINNKPILEYEIEMLREQGYTDILLIIGHLGHIIKDYFKDGSDWGVKISYFIEEEPLGTAGALYYLKKELTEDFFLLNGDVIMDLDLNRMKQYHQRHDGEITLLTHPNSHPYDSALIVTNDHGQVKQWLHKEDSRSVYKNRVNAGVHILSPRALDLITGPGKWDLDRDILKPLVPRGIVYAYDSPEYVHDMGTPERYYAVTEDLLSGKVNSKNLHNKQKAVFLDRDGTLNVYKGFITDPDQIELLPGVAKAIKIINDSGYLAIVISNQPVIARGDCTIAELDDINNAMETKLGLEGAYIDDLFYCPHHPDKGFEGERPEYKFECECRKPKPGLLLKAAEKYNIDLSSSFMVGDSEIDIKAGINAGCVPIYIGQSSIDSSLKFDSYHSLLDFVNDKIN